jgi:hypothetical protein
VAQRRRIILLATFIGLLLSLLFSWLPLLWAHRAAFHVSETNPRWPEASPPDWPAQPDAANRVSGVWGVRIDSAAHNLDRLAQTRRQDPTVIVHWMSRWEFGVPFRSMSRIAMSTQAGRIITPTPLSTWHTGLRTSARFQNGLAAREFVPLRPIWPGFIANWLIFAMATWGAITGVQRLRAGRLKRRGLCEHCACSLAGLATCPECGHARHVS